jgi:SAM-dependent methyltransferase
MTHALLERGFAITAVDESSEMLERVRGARTICSPIEDLDLGERFDVVMLASFLVHAGDVEVRRGLLRTCARHLAEGGHVLIQREGADYHTNLPRERVGPSGSTIRLVSSEPVGDGVNSVRAEYEFPDAVWTQTFLARPLTREQFEEALGEAGLKVDRYLTEDEVWVRVVSG